MKTDIEWTHDNVAMLARWMADEVGATGSEVADVVEKPWHYVDEYYLAKEAQDAE